MDTRLPGQLYAVVARRKCGRHGQGYGRRDAQGIGRRKSCRSGYSGAPQFNPLGGVAVIASNTGSDAGRKALQIVWDDGPNAT
jgi:isoquinoline 1-oxidoreductase beta subunit